MNFSVAFTHMYRQLRPACLAQRTGGGVRIRCPARPAHAPPRALRPARAEPRARRRPGRPIRAPSYGNETRSVARSMRSRHAGRAHTRPRVHAQDSPPSAPSVDMPASRTQVASATYCERGAHHARACHMVLDVLTRTQRNGRSPTAQRPNGPTAQRPSTRGSIDQQGV